MCIKGRRLQAWLLAGLGAMWSGLAGEDPYQPPGILWEREYDSEGFTRSIYGAFLPLDEGGGILTSDPLQGSPQTIGRIDSAGDITWRTSIAGYVTTGTTLIPTATLPGDQFVLPFHDNIGDEASSNLHFLSLNAAGDTLWERLVPIPPPNGGYLRVTESFRTSGGSFLFGGEVIFPNGANEEATSFFIDVSRDGTFGAPRYVRGTVFAVLEPLPSGGALLRASIPPTSGTPHQRLLKLDSEGGVEWDIPLESPTRHIRGTASGGSVMLYSDRLDWFDSNGVLVHSQEFPLPGLVTIHSTFRVLADGGLIIAAIFRLPEENLQDELRLIRTDDRGEILWRLSGPQRSLSPFVGVEPDGSFLVVFDHQLIDTEWQKVGFRTEPDPVSRPPVSFIRGDANGDGSVDIADPVATLGFLFLGDTAPGCMEAANTNDDGEVDISDPVHTLNYLFVGGAPIPPPFPEKGTDPTPGAPGCSSTK